MRTIDRSYIIASTTSSHVAMQAAHECLEKGELAEAAECFEKAANEIEGSLETKASCFLNAGACLISLGDYKKGLICLESATNTISTQSPTESQEKDGEDSGTMLEVSADVCYNSAVAHQALSDYEQAVVKFEQCADLYEKAGHLQNAADVLSVLASCHRDAGQQEDELACLTRAQSVYRQLGDCGGEAMAYATLARAYLRAGREADCRQMLSTAKMIGSRVDDQKLSGQLHSQYGLIHSSLCQYNDALQNFERALPLVRAADDGSELQEASLLQNIGATYNEKQMYSESLVYHREAAAMHGRLKRYDCEIKCLCNLAFAQSQLRDYTSSLSTFREALEKARTVDNVCLQLQACEGLGVCFYHLNQYSKAVESFNSALQLLDTIKEDTGIARERVMEKLSDITEALQNNAEVTDHLKAADGSSPALNGESPSAKASNETSRLPLDHSAGKVMSAKKKGKRSKSNELLQTQPTTLGNQDSCDLEIQAYEETLVSSESSDDEDGMLANGLNESTDHLKTSNKAHKTETQQPTLTPILSQSSLSQGQGDSYTQSSVAEGSLAIGPNARDTYTIQRSRVESEGKGRRGKGTTEIVKRERKTSADELESAPIDEQPLPGDHSLGSTQQSRMCRIL